MTRFMLGFISLIVCSLAAISFFSLSNAAEAQPKVSTTEVCFNAHNLGDNIKVTGTMYADKKSYSADTPLLLTLHGFSTDRSLWDGYFAGPQLAGSMAREMAKKGYVVIAIDRPAYGDSAYQTPLSGYKVSGQTQIDMTHEIVTQIKSGAFSQTAESCPGGEKAPFGFARIVMLGHSFSGAIVSGYATKYKDIEAIINWGYSHQGSNPELIVQSTQNFAPTKLSFDGYANFYADGPDEVSAQCKKSYYEPGMNSTVLNTVCANKNLLPTPVGELLSSPSMSAANNAGIAAKTIGHIKVLITFGEYDNDFPRSGPSGNLQQAEIDYWQNHCECDVSSYIQPDTGHNGMLHYSMPATANEFDRWLSSRGLGGSR